MTKAEYTRQYRQARKNYPRILRHAMTQLRKTYKQAADVAAAEVAKAQLGGLSGLTQESWASIEEQLRRSVLEINDALQTGTRAAVLRGAEETSRIHEQHLTEALRAAGSSQALRAGVRTMFRAINERVIQNLVGRIYQNGYTFSETVWKTAESYQEQIKDVISAGIAQGRPVEKIARDVQVYVADGKVRLAQRFGKLERGTREFMNRIGNRVDYRALRLVRTELFTSVREASREQGHSNPGSTDLYDWVLEAGRQQWNCDCPSLADGGPYTYYQVPGTPHANCNCDVRPRLRDADDFVGDLKRWINGGQVDYLDTWYRDQYLPLQSPLAMSRRAVKIIRQVKRENVYMK